MSSILKLCAQVCYTSFRHKFISAFTYKISVFTSKIDAKTQSNYEIGRNVEFRICTFLDNLGWITTLSPGSRGPADITATKRELTLVAKNFDENDLINKIKQKLCIQVKFRSDIEYHSLSTTEWHYLADHSVKYNCPPIVATVSKFLGKQFEQMSLNYEHGRPWNLGDGYVAYFHNILNGEEFRP